MAARKSRASRGARTRRAGPRAPRADARAGRSVIARGARPPAAVRAPVLREVALLRRWPRVARILACSQRPTRAARPPPPETARN